MRLCWRHCRHAVRSGRYTFRSSARAVAGRAGCSGLAGHGHGQGQGRVGKGRGWQGCGGEQDARGEGGARAGRRPKVLGLAGRRQMGRRTARTGGQAKPRERGRKRGQGLLDKASATCLRGGAGRPGSSLAPGGAALGVGGASGVFGCLPVLRRLMLRRCGTWREGSSPCSTRSCQVGSHEDGDLGYAFFFANQRHCPLGSPASLFVRLYGSSG